MPRRRRRSTRRGHKRRPKWLRGCCVRRTGCAPPPWSSRLNVIARGAIQALTAALPQRKPESLTDTREAALRKIATRGGAHPACPVPIIVELHARRPIRLLITRLGSCCPAVLQSSSSSMRWLRRRISSRALRPVSHHPCPARDQQGTKVEQTGSSRCLSRFSPSLWLSVVHVTRRLPKRKRDG
jgi:hypothetical protein